VTAFQGFMLKLYINAIDVAAIAVANMIVGI